MTEKNIHNEFSTPLLHWFDVHGRKDLPWQTPRIAYRVWVSEIMLQQTQVQTVIAYFNRFIDRLPTLIDLANACDDEVLSLWSGLGYYSRARNLHLAAKIIAKDHQGIFPTTLDALIDLPGIGPSTAAAILSQAFDKPTAILDANVKRVLARYFLIKGPTEQAQVKKKLWELANTCMPQARCADYTQAIMDLGATCCTTKNPNCTGCPLRVNCLALKEGEQSNYPTKKIKKPVPVLHQQFLVLLNEQGDVYLEKRPSSGLWGGLWCLPSLELEDCPLAFIEDRYALKGETPRKLISFKHHFSHFHLNIHAISIKTDYLQNKPLDGQWFRHEQFASLGLAKPTYLILNAQAGVTS